MDIIVLIISIVVGFIVGYLIAPYIAKLQFIWYGEWQGFHIEKPEHGLALIYDWFLWLGLLEVRKWKQ